jgi:peptidoglycan/LPS O-acetylase OafA/YrhL
MTEKTRFYALDGLRGLAAISVMLFHYTEQNGLNWFKAAPMSVDLFFILSGFVIMHGYGGEIARGMTFRHFIWQRLLRLWPLYLIGLFIGLLAVSAQGLALQDIVIAAVLGSLILPDFNHATWAFETGTTTGVLFPLNGPSWLLFFEMAVNIVFFAYLTWRPKTDFKTPAAVFLAIYAACIWLTGQVNPGWGIDNFSLGFPRVIAEFSLGAFLYTQRDRVPEISVYVPLALAVAVFGSFLFADGRWLLVNILLLLPALILTASKVKPGPIGRKAGALLGDISYPLYIVHAPVYALLYQLLPLADLRPAVRTLCVAGLVLSVSFALAQADKTLRKRLKDLAWRGKSAKGIVT